MTTRPPFSSDDNSDVFHEEFHPLPSAMAAAIAATAATYGYFLIFAQFGFLKAVQAALGEQNAMLKPVLGAMVLGGIAGSVVAAKLFTPRRAARLLIGAYATCAAAAGLTFAAKTAALLFVVSAATGLGTGLATVALAATLRRVIGGERLGSCIGAGTGIAYALCNLPVFFNASGHGQAALGVIAACVGMVSVQGLDLRAPKPPVQSARDYKGFGVAAWIAIFFTLVWLDSAAFYVIQHAPTLHANAWSGRGRLFAIAAVHAMAALLAGYALDRRWLGRTVFAAVGMLFAACVLIDRGYEVFTEGVLLYPAAVSLYSTALVFYVARSAEPRLAALVYAIAGWGASALGIGMAQNLNNVPRPFLLGASGVLAAALLVRGIVKWRTKRA